MTEHRYIDIVPLEKDGWFLSRQSKTLFPAHIPRQGRKRENRMPPLRKAPRRGENAILLQLRRTVRGGTGCLM